MYYKMYSHSELDPGFYVLNTIVYSLPCFYFVLFTFVYKNSYNGNLNLLFIL